MAIEIPDKYAQAIRYIKELYLVHSVGGYGHIVFDDCNYDCVKGCLDDARASVNAKHYDDPIKHEKVRQVSIKALEACKDFDEDEVELCVVLYRAIENGYLTAQLKPA